MKNMIQAILVGALLLPYAFNGGICSAAPDIKPITGTELNMVAFGTMPDAGLDFSNGNYTLYSFGPSGISDCRSKSDIDKEGRFYATIIGNVEGDTISFQVISSETGLVYYLQDTLTFRGDATLADLELH